ncbi:substrate-binding domain-containing protein [Kitasatospora sp. MY 5-36]|uniref:substrate-binding domain-containing protein n=1 Tax=Kitasatospora sp. MY 5-36 TaxID=1678027 RepID=UPI0009EACA5D|nr:substrate-binding domain-containing protein [Kitasatospora sp. MY 5-36]
MVAPSGVIGGHMTDVRRATAGRTSGERWRPARCRPAATAAADLVGVGAPAADALLNQLAADYNASLAAAGDTTSPRLYSWDARGSSTITPKTGASEIFRPTNTRSALNALAFNSSGTVDFARLSRPPQQGDLTSIDFVPLVRDAVTWAAPAGGNAPKNLTTADLRWIYSCDITNWRQIDPSLPDATIRPVVPGVHVSDPATLRSSYLSDEMTAFAAAASPNGDPGTFYAGPCVTSGVAEDQGEDAVLHDPNAIVPYSVGRWVGQVTGGHRKPGDDPGVLVPQSLDGTAPTVDGGTNPAFLTTWYGRALYVGVRDGDWTSVDAQGRALRAVFGRNGWFCTSPAAAADVRSHGFLRLPAFVCGATTHA